MDWEPFTPGFWISSDVAGRGWEEHTSPPDSLRAGTMGSYREQIIIYPKSLLEQLWKPKTIPLKYGVWRMLEHILFKLLLLLLSFTYFVCLPVCMCGHITTTEGISFLLPSVDPGI